MSVFPSVANLAATSAFTEHVSLRCEQTLYKVNISCQIKSAHLSPFDGVILLPTEFFNFSDSSPSFAFLPFLRCSQIQACRRLQWCRVTAKEKSAAARKRTKGEPRRTRSSTSPFRRRENLSTCRVISKKEISRRASAFFI